jgi:hypothetical protein
MVDMKPLRDRDRVTFTGEDSPTDRVLAGQPGLVVDEVNQFDHRVEVMVAFVRGPSLCMPVTDVELVSKEEWEQRRGRLANGMHPARDAQLPGWITTVFDDAGS